MLIFIEGLFFRFLTSILTTKKSGTSYLVMLTIFSCIPLHSWSQANSLTNNTSDSYLFNFVSFADGSTTGYVNSLVQDTTGIIWLGSENGLLKYNGKTLQIFNRNSTDNPLDIADEISIYSVDESTLLLQENHFIHWFDIKNQVISKSIDLQKQGLKKECYKLVIMDDQSVWLVTNNDFDLSFDIISIKADGKLTLVDQAITHGFPNIIRRNESVIVARDGGVNIYNTTNNSKKEILAQDNEALLTPSSLLVDEEGTIWLKGDCEFEFNESVFPNISPYTKMDCNIYYLEEGANMLRSFEFDNIALKGSFFMDKTEDAFWIGGSHLNLKQIKTNSKDCIDYTTILIDAYNRLNRSSYFTQILATYFLGNDVIFICTTAGLIKAEPNPAAKYQTILRSNATFCESICLIHGMTEDEDGNIYLCNNNELMMMDQNNDLEIIATKELNNDVATSYSIHYYEGKIYWNDHVVDLQSKKVKPILDKIWGNEICNFLDHDGHLWLESYDETKKELELNKYDFETKTSIKIQGTDSFKNAIHINHIVQTESNHKIWLGTQKGLFYVNEKSDTTIVPFEFSFNDGKDSIDNILCLYAESESSIWVGSDEGLLRINTKNHKADQYSDLFQKSNNNLAKRAVYSILPVEDDKLMLGTNQGLILFDKASKTFSKIKGLGVLANEEFNRLAAYHSKDGYLYFGSVNGLFKFKYEDILAYFNYTNQYQLQINSFQVFNEKTGLRSFKNIDENETIELNHKDNYFEVEYSMPDNLFAKELMYSYKLDGLDNTWSTPTNSNQLRFNHLPPGEYALKIKTGFDVNNLENSERQIQLKVHQAWFKTWWFNLLIFGLTVFIIYSFLQYRFKQKEKERIKFEKLRTSISTDLHDDVGSILAGLSMQAQIASMGLEKQVNKNKLDNIAMLSSKAIEMMRDSVWAIDSRQDKFVNLIDKMREFAHTSFEDTSISCSIVLVGLDGLGKILPNVRKEFYFIYKEALSNIIKHSNASQVDVTIKKENGSLFMIIHDNGNAKKHQPTAGQGTSNMKMRAARLKGELAIDTQSGYKIELKIPFAA